MIGDRTGTIPRSVHIPWYAANLVIFIVVLSVGHVDPSTVWPAFNLLIWAIAVMFGKVR